MPLLECDQVLPHELPAEGMEGQDQEEERIHLWLSAICLL